MKTHAADDVTQLEKFQVKEEPVAWLGIGVSARSHGFFGQPKAPFIVVQVAQQSPAHRAGIQVLDEIISIDGDSGLSFEDIGRQLYRASTGEKIELVIRRPTVRDTKVISFQATSREAMHSRSRDKNIPQVFWDVFVAHLGKVDVETPKKHPAWKNAARSCSLSWSGAKVTLAEIPGRGVLISTAPTTKDRVLQGELVPAGSTIKLLDDGGYEVIQPLQESSEKK